MNRITIVGNLTRDPETKETTGATWVEFSVADNPSKKRQEAGYVTTYTRVSMTTESPWAASSQEMTKGESVTVIGELLEQEGTDGKRYREIKFPDIVARGGRRPAADGIATSPGKMSKSQAVLPVTKSKGKSKGKIKVDPFGGVGGGDIPF